MRRGEEDVWAGKGLVFRVDGGGEDVGWVGGGIAEKTIFGWV